MSHRVGPFFETLSGDVPEKGPNKPKDWIDSIDFSDPGSRNGVNRYAVSALPHLAKSKSGRRGSYR
jgi:hypothetical protein